MNQEAQIGHVQMNAVAEANRFQRRAPAIMNDDERMTVIDHLARNPTAGVSIGAGTWKLRLAREGGGKSGGFRVIYFYRMDENIPIFLLKVFAKGDKENLSKAETEELKTLGQMLADSYRSRQ